MRESKMERKTTETEVQVLLRLDGTGLGEIDTGIGFFDHMLTALRRHAGFDLTVKVKGDLQVDCHHTVEDAGIVLGQALGAALGEKGGICRYGHFLLPMDEALAQCAVDVSGRPFLVFDCPFTHRVMGEMETAMVEEFFRAFAFGAGITLHLRLLYGSNDHHKAEALFKAAAHALKMALKPAKDRAVLSTKGVL